MRSIRTAFAATLPAVVAALALTVGSAGQAAASEQPPAPVQAGMQDEVPWTGPVPGIVIEVPWT
ncbi:hypothetical protein AMK16_29655 [Streptomyces sp. CB00455]|uniref:hypothetical protein n=1 Tax=Streptomyces sp. CB00455 TaxID=1703927 RepID=UPI00093C40A6|nr:hypothetical protein [Streptomyces sp. CB00455]OKK14723.1 hypothetical protein AMK16_29655 [Streptomyces sp. CB00455]